MISHSRIQINFTSLMNAFRDEGFTGAREEQELIMVIEDWLINEKGIKPELMCQINHAAVKHCTQGGNKTYEHYVWALCNCKSLRTLNIPADELRAKAKKELEDWDKIIDDISSSKKIEGDSNDVEIKETH